MDSSTSSKLIEFQFDASSYDASNPLVLPGSKKKNHTGTKADRKKQVELHDKVLSKKRRKELERKLSQKTKKLTRADLWKELGEYNSNGNVNKISVLPLFNRTKRPKKVMNEASVSLKGKSWRGVSDHESASSMSTDDYSTDEEDHDSQTPLDPVIPADATADKMKISPTDDTKPATSDQNTLNPDPLAPKSGMYFKPNHFILVSRKPEIEVSRLALPILSDETTIMDNINNHDCVIICGATGCGKTTQVPQFLYEAGYASDGYIIGVTEPRRVAAVSMSRRVSEELNLKSNAVSYHIRFDKTVAPETKIKFMTDGILLQEIKQDFELSKYSTIIVDEAHERSVYTDVLLGLLSMIIRLRRRRYSENIATKGRVLIPLKLIIMSATLRVTDFSENHRLFPPSIGVPPVIQVESRQFPVTCHFAKITYSDYLKAAFKKVVSIHRDSPAGGILVFVTGRQEAHTLCSWLSRAFQKPVEEKNSQKPRLDVQNNPKEDSKSASLGEDSEQKPASNEKPTTTESHVCSIDLDSFDIIPADEESEVGHLRRHRKSPDTDKKATNSSNPNDYEKSHLESSDLEDDGLDEPDYDDEILEELTATSKAESPVAPIHALPLYSLLPPERQQQVFQPPPEGHRLVVVSTNVAETSLTIPDIRFVVDTGKVKSKIYDPATGAGSFEIVWISQASAEQRAGRAGRVGPGHCYRLYSSQVFSRMQQFPYPDILLRPIDEVVLMLKSYLGTTPLSLFPLPTPPSSSSVDAAEHRLIALGALEELPGKANGPIRTITRAGRWMVRLPVPVRFGRMLLFANQHQLMPYAVILVAALTVPDLLLPVGSLPKSSDQSDDNLSKTQQTEQEDSSSRFKTNFAQQFVRRSEDLLLGDLSVLLGTICCLERYYAQMNGLIPPEPGIIKFCGGFDRVKRDPDGAMRILVDRCGVRWNAYREVRQLRRQLTDILNANIPNLNLVVDPVLPRPSPEQIIQLCQLYLVGSPCHVASKLSVSIPGLPASERRRLRYAYEIPGRRDPVYIEPNSPLARENSSFIAYLELFKTSKPLLRTVCSIDPAWLPFLAPYSIIVDGLVLSDEIQSDPSSSQDPGKSDNQDILDQTEDDDREKSKPKSIVRPPGPRYDSDRDLVITGAQSIKYIGSGLVDQDESLGDHSFLELPSSLVMVPINSPASIKSLGLTEALMWSVRWFLRFILEGIIFPELKPWFPGQIKKSLSPQLVTVSWGIIRPQVKITSSVLFQDKIDTRNKLIDKWKTDRQYLSKELASWIVNEAVDEFHAAWPPSLCADEEHKQLD